MKTHLIPSRARRTAAHIQADLVTALGLIALTVLPLGYGYLHHRQVVRNATTRAVVLELVDSEMEILAAGEHRAFQPGGAFSTASSAAPPHSPPMEVEITRRSGTSR